MEHAANFRHLFNVNFLIYKYKAKLRLLNHIYAKIILLISMFLYYDITISKMIWIAILVAAGSVMIWVYIDPPDIKKELTDVGYDHIRGPNRGMQIARAMKSRRYGADLPPPYPNGWFAVADSRELYNEAVQSVNVLGQNLCVYRGTDGKARCTEAYCPHLGANIGVDGIVRGNCIECPFHQWQFDGTGTCVLAPGQKHPPRGMNLKIWTTTEAEGAVWIWHDAEGDPPRWTVQDQDQFKGWECHGKNEYVVNSHIQDIPENGADVAHLNSVHSVSLAHNVLPFLKGWLGRHHWHADWSTGVGHEANITMEHQYILPVYPHPAFIVRAEILQEGPGHVRLVLDSGFGPLMISQTVTPLSPFEQRVVHRIYSPIYNALVAAIFLWLESIMFERDVRIWNHKRYTNKPGYGKADGKVKAYRIWFAQFYSQNSRSFQRAQMDYQDPLGW